MAEPVTIKAQYFSRGGKRFIVNGVVYQLKPVDGNIRRPVDPLADDQLEVLEAAIPLFKELLLNTLFVYYIDETKNHDAAMNLLAEAGIYVLVCTSGPNRVIHREMSAASYTPRLLQGYFRVVDAMAKYPNTLGFSVADEVINNYSTTDAAPIIRAVTRDVKRYIALQAAKRLQRVIPVGITAGDVWASLEHQFKYSCAGNDEDSVDFFAFNTYSWSGESSMQASGYNNLVTVFESSPVPVFFSQYGNNFQSPRLFRETVAIYADQDMLRVFSGAIVYEFFEEMNRYGLVRRSNNPDIIRLKKLKDFKTLRASLRLALPPLQSALATNVDLRHTFGPVLFESVIPTDTVCVRNLPWRTAEHLNSIFLPDIVKDYSTERKHNGPVDGIIWFHSIASAETAISKFQGRLFKETTLDMCFATYVPVENQYKRIEYSYIAHEPRERPNMPCESTWRASFILVPESPIDWAEVEEQIEMQRIEDGEWVDVQKEVDNMAVDALTSSIKNRLIIDDTDDYTLV